MLALFFLFLSIDPIDYGADPTGVNNSLQAFRLAIDEMELTGESIEITDGNYRIEVFSTSDLEQGYIFKQTPGKTWNIEGSGKNCIIDVYPKNLSFSFAVFGLSGGSSSTVGNFTLDGSDTIYSPGTTWSVLKDENERSKVGNFKGSSTWSIAFWIYSSNESEDNTINIENVHFTNIWRNAIFKSGDGNFLTINVDNLIVDQTVGDSIGIYASDNHTVTFNASNCSIIESGLPSYSHGFYIHPHVTTHIRNSSFEKVYQYAIKYYSNSGSQTVVPEHVLVENCTFYDVGNSIVYDGPESVVVMSRNNTFYSQAFYQGYSIKSVDDSFIYETRSDACIVGNPLDSADGRSWEFINPTAKNAIFKLASSNVNAGQEVFIFRGAKFFNTTITQTHDVQNAKQRVIIDGIYSVHDNSTYLFRPLTGKWDISNFNIVGSFDNAPWSAPFLTDTFHSIIRYKVQNGYVNLTTPKVFINRASSPSPVVQHNVDLDVPSSLGNSEK